MKGRKSVRSRSAVWLRAGRASLAGVFAATVLALTLPSLGDDVMLTDLHSLDMASKFEGIRLFRAGLRGVDRRSLEAVIGFLELEERGAVPPETARGVRAVLGEPWYTDFWRFLSLPLDGPTPREVASRVDSARDPGAGPAYELGLAWGADMALGRGSASWQFLAIPPPDP